MSAPNAFEEFEDFDDFVRAQSRGLLRAAWLLSGDWAAAEDLVQTALAATWRHWAAITRTDAPQVYTRRILLTTFLSGKRRRWSGEVATEHPPERADPDEFGAIDLRSTLITAMQSLPPRQRAVVTMRYFADLTEKETAEALGCSVGTVKSQSSKALARLRHSDVLSGLVADGGVR